MEPESEITIDPYLRRLAMRLSADIGRDVEAARFGDGRPFFFAARELLVAADERELLAACATAGAELVHPRPIPPQPPEIARTRHPGPQDAPRPVVVRLDPPAADDETRSGLRRVADKKSGDGSNRSLQFSSDHALALAGHAVRLKSEGRAVSLNYVAVPGALRHRKIAEDTGVAEGADVAGWPWLGNPVRIIDAWQLFESYRASGPTQSLIWIAIFDNGFDLDAAGVPVSADLANCSPLRNLIDETQPIGGAGQANAMWHGTWVASCAVGLVGNKHGIAGSGGTIAYGALFRTNYSFHEALECLTHATAWGLDIVNMSCEWLGGFDDDDDDRNLFSETFQWAADNGTIIVVAAGNDNLEIPGTEVRPASHTPGVITVGNIDPATWAAYNHPTDGSNYGTSVNIWAPGTNIPCVSGPPTPAASFPAVTGTSLAAPFVAGVIAMMLAIRPNLRVDQVRKILQDTAWSGTDGRINFGLDARAALLATMDGRLPVEFEEWAGGNNSAATAALLAPVLGNADHLGPIGGTCTHNPGDHDWWRFTLSSLKTVIISLEWYERLSALALFIEADDPGNEGVDMLTRHSLPGVTVLTGILGPGTYRLRVTGSGATAYEIGVRLSRAILQPDGFEPNNGFDAAATLLFHASQRPVYVLLGRWWGPGTFDGTLNWRTVAIGPYIIPLMDADWFRLDGRVEIGSQQRFCDVHHLDEPVDIFLYNRDRNRIDQWLGRKSPLSIRLDKAEIHYLELRSQRQTRYRITTGMMVDPAILPPDIDLAKVFPEWWKKNPFVELGVDPSWHFIQIGEGEYDVNPAFESALQFEDLSGDAEITLLDAAGQVIRQASAKGGGRPGDALVRTLQVERLAPGSYFLRVARGARSAGGELARLNLLAPLRVGQAGQMVEQPPLDPTYGAADAPDNQPDR